MKIEQNSGGKYAEECSKLFEETQARGVVLIVIEGKKGNGLSIEAKPSFGPELIKNLPTLFRKVANLIEKETKVDRSVN